MWMGWLYAIRTSRTNQKRNEERGKNPKEVIWMRNHNEWMQYEMDFVESKERFAKTGECKHEEKFLEVINPYKCNVKLITCSICNNTLDKVYLG